MEAIGLASNKFHVSPVQGRTLPLSQTLALFDIQKFISILISDLAEFENMPKGPLFHYKITNNWFLSPMMRVGDERMLRQERGQYVNNRDFADFCSPSSHI